MTTNNYNFNDYPVEGPVNEERLPVMILVDVSGSMRDAVGDVNAAINHFVREVNKDTKAAKLIDVCVIAFNDTAKVIQPWTVISKMESVCMTADGGTNFSAGLELAEEMLTGRGRQYISLGINVKMPQLIILTDGYGGDITEIAGELRKRADEDKLHIWVLAVPGYHEESVAQLTQGKRCLELHGDTSGFTEAFDFYSLAYKAMSTSAPGAAIHVDHKLGDVEQGSKWHKPDLDDWLK